jgi:hypothetical protein
VHFGVHIGGEARAISRASQGEARSQIERVVREKNLAAKGKLKVKMVLTGEGMPPTKVTK